MKEGEPPTFLVPEERASREEVLRQFSALCGSDFLKSLLDAVPNGIAIMNKERQIVYLNRGMRELLGTEDMRENIGLRPGEALQCIHAGETAGGCGASEACRFCGTLLSLVCSLQGKENTRECRMSRVCNGEIQALDLRVSSAPFDYCGERFHLFTLTDISNEKRRNALERIFFHDILNAAGSLPGIVEILEEEGLCEENPYLALMRSAAERIIDEIEAHRMLVYAERDELTVFPGMIVLPDFLQDLAGMYRQCEFAQGRTIVVDPAGGHVVFRSDGALAGRVVGNMLKNALEASGEGDTVTVWYRVNGDKIEISVHNPVVIPRDVRVQVFQRSFSTKGRGRGLGTYSMKLLGERYLKGKVSFTTSEEGGTVFTACFPLHLEPGD
ncbi:MAG: PAS domain-containing sensor histidine kinase [Alphaproteobacteria bacterium]|uniref:histidine kinase n=1 Tax=Candidatus Nitrobium versatile TaxID=2884831 RepID=A0A953JAJ7_9BACT|nr:PAS domain-containing sensor histidine kinase [Candidatus Nitrobium versatile]